ncbi:hypothetical protein D3C86_2055110 [compost metagenome]
MPEIFAPMATRHSATLVISGSCAAFSIMVVPRASVAAIRIVWVAPTETLGKLTVAPIRPPLGARATT